MLTQLLYISRHDGIMDDITTFMSSNRERNKELGVASILLSTELYYIHLIEGHRIDVNCLYNRITKDKKHKDCTILRYIDVKKREFHNWYAEHVNITEFNIGDMNLLLPLGDLDIETITSAQAVAMIRRIHAHLLVNQPAMPVAHPVHD